MMPKLLITLTEELQDALRAESERRNTTIAAIVREYIAAGLAKNGIEIKERVKWGGNRHKPKTSTKDEKG
jgi:hypothetical protein